MATRAVAMGMCYVAWDTGANAGKTGDVSNHTLRWIKDAGETTPANSPAEVDATNCPGLYSLALTSGETDCNIGVLGGKSSTSGVSLIPVTIQFERLPDAAPDHNGGVPILSGGAAALAYKVDLQDVPNATALAAIAVALLTHANGIEPGYALDDVLRLVLAALGGKSSGHPGSPVYRDANDTVNRITATTDTSGNRTAVTLNP